MPSALLVAVGLKRQKLDAALFHPKYKQWMSALSPDKEKEILCGCVCLPIAMIPGGLSSLWVKG